MAKISRRIKGYKIEIINEPRPGKKLLVLDIDYTLFGKITDKGQFGNFRRGEGATLPRAGWEGTNDLCQNFKKNLILRKFSRPPPGNLPIGRVLTLHISTYLKQLHQASLIIIK